MDIIKKINKAKTIWQILPDLTEEELEKTIFLAAESYYNSDVSLLTDEVYDVLVDRLRTLNPKSKVLKQIGAPVGKGKKVELPFWMGSMNKIKSDEKLIEKWIKEFKAPYVVSDKLDGISCLLTITDGEIKLYTRGSGSIGQDITHLADLANMSTDKLIKQNIDCAIRGELIMPKKTFEEKYSNVMANARNMVAGIVNSKPESVNKKYARDVDFVTYEIIEPVMKPSDQMKTLQKWGLNVVYWDIYQDISLEILDAILQKRKKKSIYEIDGIIVTEDVRRPRNKSGNPPYSFAYKGSSPMIEVKVLAVEWNPSKDGYLVPVVHYEKTKLSGVDMKQATGFNAKFIVDNKIGPGAIIQVVRSGDVIPYITSVIKPAKKPSLPEDMDYEWDDNEVNIILKNADKNENVIIQRLTKFMRYIGVENLSEGIVAKLVAGGYDSIPKVISLTVEDFLSMDGFQETLANKLYNNLQDALDKLNILTLMAASNVFGRGFGERKIKKILDVYPNIVNEFSGKTKSGPWIDKLIAIDGFDTISTEQFLQALPEFQAFYKKVSKLVNVKPYVNKANKEGSFKDMVVTFTGFRNKSWQEFILAEGGKVTTTVSKNTKLLVVNDGEESSAKFIMAKKLGIKTMSKSEFAKKYKI